MKSALGSKSQYMPLEDPMTQIRKGGYSLQNGNLLETYPGVIWNANNLDIFTYVQQYEIEIDHTGWASSVFREYTSATENAEKGSSFGCNCNYQLPMYTCERVALQDGKNVGWKNLANHVQKDELNKRIQRRHHDMLVRVAGPPAHVKTPGYAGLYMWSEAKDLFVAELDIMAGCKPGSSCNNGRTTSLVQDIMSHDRLKSLVFEDPSKGNHENVVAVSHFDTTCIRWPYGQVHRSSFTEAGRKNSSTTESRTARSTTAGSIQWLP